MSQDDQDKVLVVKIYCKQEAEIFFFDKCL